MRYSHYGSAHAKLLTFDEADINVSEIAGGLIKGVLKALDVLKKLILGRFGAGGAVPERIEDIRTRYERFKQYEGRSCNINYTYIMFKPRKMDILGVITDVLMQKVRDAFNDYTNLENDEYWKNKLMDYNKFFDSLNSESGSIEDLVQFDVRLAMGVTATTNGDGNVTYMTKDYLFKDVKGATYFMKTQLDMMDDINNTLLKPQKELDVMRSNLSQNPTNSSPARLNTLNAMVDHYSKIYVAITKEVDKITQILHKQMFDLMSFIENQLKMEDERNGTGDATEATAESVINYNTSTYETKKKKNGCFSGMTMI